MPHPTVQISHGENIAAVDEEVASLVLALWKAGFETVGSCQGDSGRGWVQMTGSEAFRWQNRLRGRSGLLEVRFDNVPSGRDLSKSAPRVYFWLKDVPTLISAMV